MEILNYFENLARTLLTFENMLQLATLFVLYFGTAKKSVELINQLKTFLNLSGKKAEMLVIVVSVLSAISIQLVQGILVPEMLTIQNFAFLVGTVWYAADRRYRELKETIKTDVVFISTDATVEQVDDGLLVTKDDEVDTDNINKEINIQ